ncbi:hypothetical protein ACSQ67_011838 [Phaseolus vulgaris]
MMHKPYVGYAAFMTVCITLLPMKPYLMTEFHILLLVISMLFHAVAISIAQPSITATITLHASGLLACQTLITIIIWKLNSKNFKNYNDNLELKLNALFQALADLPIPIFLCHPIMILMLHMAIHNPFGTSVFDSVETPVLIHL